jgi:Tfp pilus assembly protein PilF
MKTMKTIISKTSLSCAAILCLGASSTLHPLAAQAQQASQPDQSQAAHPVPPQLSQPAPIPDAIRSLIKLGRRDTPLAPEQQARVDQRDLLCHAAAVALHAGDYAQAEAGARQVMALGDGSGQGQELLAGALDGQGKTQEALLEYEEIVTKMGNTHQRVLLPYALLLLKTGHWAQAVAVYDKAMPPASEAKQIKKKDGIWLLRADTQFSADTPNPEGLATAIHIARGLLYDSSGDFAHESQDDLALNEYRKAMDLMPESALTNYFYGYGLGKLGLTEQSTAAYQKASSLAGGDVRSATEGAPIK